MVTSLEAMMSPWISRATTTSFASAKSASSPTLARNAGSLSSALWCPPTAVLTIGIPNAAAQRTPLMPCSRPLPGGQVGVGAEADRGETVLVKQASYRARIPVQVDVLRPARDRGQLHVAVPCLGDPGEGLIEGVRVVRVGVPRQRVRHHPSHQAGGAQW